MSVDLRPLDPGDPRTPSQQIANALRAAILREQFRAGDKLPSQHALAAHFGVARETVKSALHILDREELIVSRQGSGVFVRARRGIPLDLEGLLRSAFDRPHVTIDYSGFSGETLSRTLPAALSDIDEGKLRSLRIRLMLTDPASLTGFPRRIDGRPNDRALQRVFRQVMHTAVDRIGRAVGELSLNSASVEIRVHALGPMMKMYLLNAERVLFGFYPATEFSVTVGGTETTLHHPSGWDATLFGPSDGASLPTGPATSGPPFTEQARAWFESMWTAIATPYER
ncbi:MAG TPA: winged helix-turn-helix domain-containing protein [Mycobacteriales bacterium]|nr:winged helix-turn-helix domain-containing protein [Mycobacteriales bacterium]